MTLRPALALAAALLWLMSPATPAAEAAHADFHLGAGVSDYQRFVTYPHLEKAFAAQQAGDAATALREFRRARELLPGNPVVAIYLADAYVRFGQRDAAETVLREQLAQTPDDTQVRARLQALQPPSAPVPTQTPAPAPDPVALLHAQAQDAIYRRDWPAADRALAALDDREALTDTERAQWFNVLLALKKPDAARRLQQRSGNAGTPREQLAYAQALAAQGDAATLVAWLGSHAPRFDRAEDERQWLVLLEKSAAAGDDTATAPVRRYVPYHAANRAYHAAVALPLLLARSDDNAATALLDRLPPDAQREARFTLALHRQDYDGAATQLRALWQQRHDLAQLDALGFRLAQAGGDAQATAVLLAAWPFDGHADGNPEAMRRALLLRLADALGNHPERATAADRARLAGTLKPLPEKPAERAAGAAVFAALHDCGAVHDLLGDLSPEYGHEDWLRLGDCYRDARPGLAQYAYAEAYRRHPDTLTARALAYQAYATGDTATALAAWKSQAADSLDNPARVAAATTALAAGDRDAAARWLDAYATHDGRQDDTYWWLRAQAEPDPRKAEADLHQAIAQHADARYYARLATLLRADRRPAEAVAALRQAIALDPHDDDLVRSLAYAQADAGDPDAARAGFEALRVADPGDENLVKQLAYVSRQQGDIPAARRYAEQTIDTLTAGDDDPDDDRRLAALYDFRRLHEELGRRWNFSADLSSGTRVAAVANAPTPGTAWRSYSQLEAQYRLGTPAWQAEERLAATARLFAGGGADNAALPVYWPVLGLGLRARPWAAQNLFLAVEQQLQLDNAAHAAGARDDLMLRASVSLPANSRYNDEWHAAGNGWLAQGIYLDAAHWLQADRSAYTGDYRLGWHRKTGTGQTLEPYLHLQASRIADHGNDDDLRGGIGVRWNLWFGESRYDAWRHRAQAGIELQHAFSTYLRETDSVFLTAGVTW